MITFGILYLLSCGIVFAVFKGDDEDGERAFFLGFASLFWPIWMWAWIGYKATRMGSAWLLRPKD